MPGKPKKEGAKPASLTSAGKMKLQFWVGIALLCAAVFLLNAVMALVSGRANTSVDLTAGAVYKIEDSTRDYLQNLQKDVEVYVLAGEDSFLSENYLIQAQRIMEQYPRVSGRVRLSYVDYVSDPAFASRFPDLSLEQGNILVVSGERVKRLKLSDLFNYTLGDSGNFVITSSRAEEALTSAIMGVVSEDVEKVAMLTGNGAAAMPALNQILADNNYVLEDVTLTTMDIDPAFTFAVLLAPTSDFTENELQKLDDFLYNGGAYGKTLLYTADVAQPELPNLETFLKEWGVAVGQGVVFETDADRTYQNQPYYPVADYVDTTYKNLLADPQSRLLMPLARPLTVLFQARDNYYTTMLTQFGESAGVRPADAPDDFRASQAEVWGPMPAMVLCQRRILVDGVARKSSNVIVFASNAMLEQTSVYSTSLTNSEYTLNLFSQISERTDVVNIQPKSLAGTALTVTSRQALTLGLSLFVAVPLVILAAGIMIWLRRRYS